MDSAELQNMMLKRIPEMPNKARRVTEYLLANMREAAFRSIGEVASELSVSKAQLVRVARVLGFDGYAELKECLQHAILEQVNPAAMLSKAVGMKQELSQSILRTEHTNIEDTWMQISQEKIDSFCAMAMEARSTAFIGWGISSLVMELMYSRFCVMAMPASLIRRGSLSLVEQARAIREGALVVVCEVPSYAIDVTEAVGEARGNGAKVITITDSPAAPVCRYADLSLFISAASTTFGSSMIGAVFLAHILTSALVVSLGDKGREAIDKQAEYLHDERFYHPIFGLKY